MSTRSFNIYCGSYEIISSGLERLLKKQFFQKKAIFPVRKKLWRFFSRFIEYDKPQRTVCKGPHCFYDHYWVWYKMKSVGPRRLLNSKIFGKKADFPVKERFWPIFSHFIEHNKGHEIFFEGPQGLFDVVFAIDKSLSLGPKRSIARIFSKISCSHGDKSFWLTFLKNINYDIPPGTVFKCSKGFKTITMEVIRSFLQHMRGCWKHNFLKKNGNLPSEEKYMGPFFSFFQVWQTSKEGL